jgi:hypothetical protein
MSKTCGLVAVFFLTCGISLAKDQSEWKFYGGYGYFLADTSQVQNALNLLHAADPAVPLLSLGSHQNLHGWSIGMQQDTKSWFGGVFEASGAYGSKYFSLGSTGNVVNTASIKMRAFTVMGGPQFTLRKSSVFQPFARVQAGATLYFNTTSFLANGAPSRSDVQLDSNGFAFSAGGGSDLFFSRIVGFRISADYIHSFAFKDSQENLRCTAGLIFRF